VYAVPPTKVRNKSALEIFSFSSHPVSNESGVLHKLASCLGQNELWLVVPPYFAASVKKEVWSGELSDFSKHASHPQSSEQVNICDEAIVLEISNFLLVATPTSIRENCLLKEFVADTGSCFSFFS
jgi:hypothetical protein